MGTWDSTNAGYTYVGIALAPRFSVGKEMYNLVDESRRDDARTYAAINSPEGRLCNQCA